MSRRLTLKERAAAVHIADTLTYYYKKQKRVRSILRSAFLQQSAAQTIQHCYVSYRRNNVKRLLREAFLQQSAAQTIQFTARKYIRTSRQKREQREQREKALAEAAARRTPTPHPARCNSRPSSRSERPDISHSPTPFVSTTSPSPVPLM